MIQKKSLPFFSISSILQFSCSKLLLTKSHLPQKKNPINYASRWSLWTQTRQHTRRTNTASSGCRGVGAECSLPRATLCHATARVCIIYVALAQHFLAQRRRVLCPSFRNRGRVLCGGDLHHEHRSHSSASGCPFSSSTWARACPPATRIVPPRSWFGMEKWCLCPNATIPLGWCYRFFD